jgi:hypothetical protein
MARFPVLLDLLCCWLIMETMKESVRYQLRELRSTLLACIIVPLPAMLFWHSHFGRCVALWCFCATCFYLAATCFRSPIGPDAPAWSDKMLALALALFLAWAGFSVLWLVLVDRHDWVALFIGLQILIPSFCVVPYLSLITGWPFAAVVFSAILVGCAKGIAGAIVCLVYGWSGPRHDTSFPWTAPNLMLSTFWVNAVILCACCYRLGARAFHLVLSRADGQIG